MNLKLLTILALTTMPMAALALPAVGDKIGRASWRERV